MRILGHMEKAFPFLLSYLNGLNTVDPVHSIPYETRSAKRRRERGGEEGVAGEEGLNEEGKERGAGRGKNTAHSLKFKRMTGSAARKRDGAAASSSSSATTSATNVMYSVLSEVETKAYPWDVKSIPLPSLYALPPAHHSQPFLSDMVRVVMFCRVLSAFLEKGGVRCGGGLVDLGLFQGVDEAEKERRDGKVMDFVEKQVSKYSVLTIGLASNVSSNSSSSSSSYSSSSSSPSFSFTPPLSMDFRSPYVMSRLVRLVDAFFLHTLALCFGGGLYGQEVRECFSALCIDALEGRLMVRLPDREKPLLSLHVVPHVVREGEIGLWNFGGKNRQRKKKSLAGGLFRVCLCFEISFLHLFTRYGRSSRGVQEDEGGAAEAGARRRGHVVRDDDAEGDGASADPAGGRAVSGRQREGGRRSRGVEEWTVLRTEEEEEEEGCFARVSSTIWCLADYCTEPRVRDEQPDAGRRFHRG
jgi:hypothetical protein